jgi:hypothetical protein
MAVQMKAPVVRLDRFQDAAKVAIQARSSTAVALRLMILLEIVS